MRAVKILGSALFEGCVVCVSFRLHTDHSDSVDSGVTARCVQVVPSLAIKVLPEKSCGQPGH